MENVKCSIGQLIQIIKGVNHFAGIYAIKVYIWYVQRVTATNS